MSEPRAAVMAERMLGGGRGNESRVDGLAMAPGLGVLPAVIIDSHLASGRLLGAVAQNPHNLGLGIDEDTAFIAENDQRFRVVSSGSVYVFDGTGNTYASLSDLCAQGLPAIHDVRLHVLASGDEYDLRTRRPLEPGAEHAATGATRPRQGGQPGGTRHRRSRQSAASRRG